MRRMKMRIITCFGDRTRSRSKESLLYFFIIVSVLDEDNSVSRTDNFMNVEK